MIEVRIETDPAGDPQVVEIAGHEISPRGSEKRLCAAVSAILAMATESISVLLEERAAVDLGPGRARIDLRSVSAGSRERALFMTTALVRTLEALPPEEISIRRRAASAL